MYRKSRRRRTDVLGKGHHATILHMWHHAGPDKRLADRQSRHYYDLVQLYDCGIGKTALAGTELLREVALHKSVFYAAKWARYDQAIPGSLRLVPPDSRMQELRRDYRQMQEMIFGTAPSFEKIIETLREIERQINQSRVCPEFLASPCYFLPNRQ